MGLHIAITSIKKGFTLIELLVVISIIGLLSTLAVVALSSARNKSRDTRRLADIKQLTTALELYRDRVGAYPDSDYAGCGGWDTPGNGTFIAPLRTQGFLAQDVKDPVADGDCVNYLYYRYSAGSYGCPANRGAYYVLGVADMSTSGNPYSGSPGWSCSGRDWQSEFEWVTGQFEF